jgi:16S rRNA (guanine966-N2)-methyltransferase
VLDLYAGSGAIGVEALSRGAAHALLVESDRAAADICAANLVTVGLPGGGVSRRRVEQLVAGPPPGPAYDVVFGDPPFTLPAEDLRGVLSGLVSHGWLGPGAVVVVERSTRDAPWEWPEGMRGDRSRRYGESTLWYGRAADREEHADD